MGAAGAGDAVFDRASSSSPPSPSLPAERDARLTPPPGHERHHKVLIRETWQADEETNANITAPLPHGARGCHEGGDRPWGIMLAKPRRGQRQAKVGGRGGEQPNPHGHTHHPAHAGHRGHNLHLTKGFSCHCLTGDDKVLLIQNIRDSPGKITILLFTCGHRTGLQARDLHKAQTNKVAGDLGRYSRPLALGTSALK